MYSIETQVSNKRSCSTQKNLIFSFQDCVVMKVAQKYIGKWMEWLLNLSYSHKKKNLHGAIKALDCMWCPFETNATNEHLLTVKYDQLKSQW